MLPPVQTMFSNKPRYQNISSFYQDYPISLLGEITKINWNKASNPRSHFFRIAKVQLLQHLLCGAAQLTRRQRQRQGRRQGGALAVAQQRRQGSGGQGEVDAAGAVPRMFLDVTTCGDFTSGTWVEQQTWGFIAEWCWHMVQGMGPAGACRRVLGSESRKFLTQWFWGILSNRNLPAKVGCWSRKNVDCMFINRKITWVVSLAVKITEDFII